MEVNEIKGIVSLQVWVEEHKSAVAMFDTEKLFEQIRFEINSEMVGAARITTEASLKRDTITKLKIVKGKQEGAERVPVYQLTITSEATEALFAGMKIDPHVYKAVLFLDADDKVLGIQRLRVEEGALIGTMKNID